MNLIRIINFLLLILDGLHRVNARLIYEYHHATLLRVRPLLELSFIEKIFPDYPCLFLQALPDSYIHSRILAELYQQLSPHIAILNTNLIHATSVCRGLIVVSTSMNLSVDFITQNKPFHKHMRVYIILIKFWNQYLFFQQHWAKELLDLDVLVITVFSSQKKVYRLKSYSSEFKMVGVRKQTNYFPSDSIHQEYGRFYEVEHSVEQRIARLAEGNYAAYCTNLNNLFFMDVDEIPPKLLKDLRSFRTCLAQLFVSFGLRLGPSYLEQVNKIILRLLQSGIIDYWLIRIILLHYHRNPFNRVYEYKPQSDKNIHEPLTLSSLEVSGFS
ncbi:uncharacterized protein LOC103518539 [Diaphorina citri]|uniref:Uncharacterized protein LOC103518539 n=1 Tax=Diaphorina citri TaxID=121845 RepID=A0A3Q0JCD3_DIACI|nr:uncharacterized protein LOC103518539 [Diaphorina citri]